MKARITFRRGVLVLSIALLVISLSDSRARAGGATGPAAVTQIDQTARGRYRAHVFASVSVTRDLAYDGVHRLDVYSPARDLDRARAALVWFHPGGFTTGDKSKEADLATDLARRGYVVFVVDYTLTSFPWFDMNARIAAANVAHHEAQNAIAFVRTRATQFGIDGSLIFAGGYSAGAIMAFDLDYGASTPATRIDGAFAIAGYTNDIPRPGAAPMLDFHGTNDLLIPDALAQSACASAEHAHDRCAVETFAGLGHEIGYSRRGTILDRASAFLGSLISTKYRIGILTGAQS
jgi:acetyl esterase/lipase